MTEYRRVQEGDAITRSDLATGAANHTIQGIEFWLTFVPRITPPRTNNGMTLVIAEAIAVDRGVVVKVIQSVWPNDAGIPPITYAKSKQDEINAYFQERFGDSETDPLVIWGRQAVSEWQSWKVDGIRLVIPE